VNQEKNYISFNHLAKFKLNHYGTIQTDKK